MKVIKIVIPLLLLMVTGCGFEATCPEGKARNMCTAFFPDKPKPYDPSELEAEIAELKEQLENLYQIILETNIEVEGIQQTIVEMQVELAELELGEQIVEVIDPCGKQTAYDEVLLRTASGAHMAWYKNVGLVVLSVDQCFVTTDGTNCFMKIVEGELLSQNGSCGGL